MGAKALWLACLGVCGTALALPVQGLHRTQASVLEPVFGAVALDSCDSVCASRVTDELERLGIFSEIVVVRDSLGTPQWVVKELPRFLLVPNGRLSDEEGVSWGAGIKSPNFLGKAIALEALFLAGSSFEAQMSLSANRLGALPIAWDVYSGRTDRFDQARQYQEVSYRSSVKGEWPSNQALRTQARVEVVHVHADRAGITYNASGKEWIPAVMGGLVWDTRNRLGLTTRGIRSELGVERVGGPLGGPTDGMAEVFDFRVWQPLTARWGLHFHQLLEMQQGRTGNWRTFVLGGANSVRGIPGGDVIKASEQIATLEVRWLWVPMRSFQVLGQNLYGGVQLVAGGDVASAWNDRWGEEKMGGALVGMDLLVPFVERVRVAVATGTRGPKVQFLVGLFEKSTAQRFRIR